MTIRAFSYGGGVQSTAALVLAAQGEIDFPTFLFANTGDDSENPDTLDYVRTTAMQYGAANGIRVLEVRRTVASGEQQTLYQELTHPTRSVSIPFRMSTGAPAWRACTEDYKISVVAKWMREHGATPTSKGVVGIGISTDEIGRAKSSSSVPVYDIEYPLLTHRMDRSACVAIIQRAGLSVPPKSACFFCPYTKTPQWRALRDNHPDLFDKAVVLEETISGKEMAKGRSRIYFHNAMKPLPDAVAGHQGGLFDEDSCESGYCMT